MRLFATLGPKGQLCLPSTIRRTLGLGPGDRVWFRRTASGSFVLEVANSADAQEFEPARASLDRPALDEAELRRLAREARAARGLLALRGGGAGDEEAI